jgi:hypothetical protein
LTGTGAGLQTERAERSERARLWLKSALRFCETALFGPVDVLSRRERTLEEPEREDEASNRKGRIVTHQREPLLFPLVLD